MFAFCFPDGFFFGLSQVEIVTAVVFVCPFFGDLFQPSAFRLSRSLVYVAACAKGGGEVS